MTLLTRRQFVLAAASTPFLLNVRTAAAQTSPAMVWDQPELRALWVDAFHDGIKTPQQIDDLVAFARQANVNALFVQVRRRGDAYYLRSPLEPRTEDPDLQPGFDALQYLIERAHAGTQRLQVHAWLATQAVWHKRDVLPVDPTHPINLHGLGSPDRWLMLRDDGEAWAGDSRAGTYYLDPGHPDAARHIANVYLNVVQSYDVDGIHLDHARYYEGSGQDRRWGYNPRSVERFNRTRGYPLENWPEPSDPEWAAWRRDQVTALVRRIYLETKAVKPQVAVTCAVVAWGRGPTNVFEWERSAPYSAVFQDWRYWLAEGILDYTLPMNYYRESDAAQPQWLNDWMAWQESNRGKRAVVLGLGAYLNDHVETHAQVARARTQGPLGVALYSYAVPSRDAESQVAADMRLEALTSLRTIFPRPAPVPELPWIGRTSTGNLMVDVPGHEGVRVLVFGEGPAMSSLTDGTGVAGWVDITPGNYLVAVLGTGVDASPVTLSVKPGTTTVLRFGPGSPAS